MALKVHTPSVGRRNKGGRKCPLALPFDTEVVTTGSNSSFRRRALFEEFITPRGLSLGAFTSHLSVNTPMPQSHLPPEIFDQIIGLLRDEPEALKKCCIVSKSLVPCTRKHLFNQIKITDLKLFRRWIETFPDPAYSPANHTRSLFAKCMNTITAKDTTVGGWIRLFANVVPFRMCSEPEPNVSLNPFHILSFVKSLQVNFGSIPSSGVFKLICSLPHLEDLDVMHDPGDMDKCMDIPRPSTSPPLTGTLVFQRSRLKRIACKLLALPADLRFRNIVWKDHSPEEVEGAVALVEACSNTLEYIHIENPHQSKLCLFGICNDTGI